MPIAIPCPWSRRGRLARALAGVAAAAVVAPSAALADDTGVSGTMTSGGLQITAPADVSFGSNALTGAASTLSADLGDWSVNDARGTWAGWTVSATASAVTVDGAAVAGMTPAMKMDPPTAVTGNGTLPTISSGVKTLTGGSPTILSAAANEGIGAFTVTQGGTGDLRLELPYNAKSGSYASTLTFTIAPLAA